MDGGSYPYQPLFHARFQCNRENTNFRQVNVMDLYRLKFHYCVELSMKAFIKEETLLSNHCFLKWLLLHEMAIYFSGSKFCCRLSHKQGTILETRFQSATVMPVVRR